MKKQTIIAVTKNLFRGAFLVALIFLVVHAMPRALGQRQTGKGNATTDAPGISNLNGMMPDIATACPQWSAGPDMPTVLVRAVGVYFPADGNFYTVGGRTSDTAGSDFQHVLRYSPASNTWTQKGVTLPDNQMNNMACGVLTVSGTPFIYCVGGSAATQTTATARVFFYNPVTDVVTTLAAGDNWPGDSGGTILPGGFAVTNNKLYILGGFNINVASTNQIWKFDPTAAVGSKWTQMVNTPEGVMFAATTAIGGIIYVGGASDFQGGTVVDSTNSFSFNPGTNTIGTIAAIPRATGETRALNFHNQMWVMGGGRVAPNPSTEVDIYDPISGVWTTGLPFTTPRRNFPTDTDGSSRIFVAGGYASDGITPMSSTELFCGGDTTTGPLALLPAPLRLIDTRTGSGFFDAGNHYSNDTLRTYNIVTISGGGVPAGAQAIVGRATVVNATATGVLQESANPPPGSGNDLGRGTAIINFPPSNTISALGATFTGALDTNGQIRVHSTVPGTVDVIIDIVGYYQ